jgi:hypothetical protein
MCVLDCRNVDTQSTGSIVWCGLCSSDANDAACDHSHNRLAQRARRDASRVVFCFLLPDRFVSVGCAQLDAGDWRPKPGLPDRRPGGMANPAHE